MAQDLESEEEFHDAISEVPPYSEDSHRLIEKPECDERGINSTKESLETQEIQEIQETQESLESIESQESLESQESEDSYESEESDVKKEDSGPNLEAPFPLEPQSDKQSTLTSITSIPQKTSSIEKIEITQEAEVQAKTALFAWSSQNLAKKNKDMPEFSGLELIQELQRSSSNSIWVMKFSPDGNYLAIGGDYPNIQLYRVRLSVLEILTEYVELCAHSQPILDIAWSKSSTYLLTASADTQVHLWMIGQSDPVASFSHPNYVTCVCFHPSNANYFLSGCLDRIVRLWNIPTKSVLIAHQSEDYITSGVFSPLGDRIILGLAHGQCFIYELEDTTLRFITQISCKNRRGIFSKGKKITGIDFADDKTFLVTTNDSRLRLFSLYNFDLIQKYKGLKNRSSPIRGSCSQCSMHVICGSENGYVYIWDKYTKYTPKINTRSAMTRIKNNSYEYFLASSVGKPVSAVFAPLHVVNELQRRMKDIGGDIVVGHVIVAGTTDGTLKVYYNQFKNVQW